MEMPSNCELRTRSVRKRTNNGCQSPSTPAHGDASQKDHAFRVGAFRCEAEPIANPGKLEALGSEAATTGERRNAAPIKPADSAIITIPICWALKRSRHDSSKRLSARGSPFFFVSKRK